MRAMYFQRLLPFFCLLVFCTYGIFFQEIAFAEDGIQTRLGQGELIIRQKVVKGTPVPQITAYGVIDARPADVWAIIEKCANYPKTMVRVISATELSRKGQKVRCRVTIDMPLGMNDLTATTDAIHTVKPGKLYKRKWSLVEGDYSANSGQWTLTPFGKDPNRTLVVYVIHAVPKSAIPNTVLKLAQRKAIPGLFKKLKEGTK